ncbi:hypothetical protein SAICODRAFT_116741 [Saitoella complicata NRRL Y-17804]|uniref:Uncharacterized protein n=1 Tax=Saitoella complicata (strain BCRC 22490 / CBS 7301 / JCM 7358 / NBRC 10748 / NRRL Y-17804) TaxID=698492 RepID=A0A0E9N8S9_SAICN|nr:uncharacterized protein SAICODRAFT_116741 [Saitoella complicata NRRL Y-17804]ODQ53087.1 hypothetical protein SAICODRAFT_116741 [Saitoella complicata NRRL Y-17804]GAO46208.1 hypothetical protein G7K_0443-t1 [Saitoella complicata NRRL Y-17804]
MNSSPGCLGTYATHHEITQHSPTRESPFWVTRRKFPRSFTAQTSPSAAFSVPSNVGSVANGLGAGRARSTPPTRHSLKHKKPCISSYRPDIDKRTSAITLGNAKRPGRARKTPAQPQDAELEPDIAVTDLTDLPDDATTEMIETAALPLLSRAFKVRLVVSRPGQSAYPELLTEMKLQWDWNVAGLHIKDKVRMRLNHDQTFSTEVREDDYTLEFAYRVVRGNFRLGPTRIWGIDKWRAFLEEMEDMRTRWKLNDFIPATS